MKRKREKEAKILNFMNLWSNNSKMKKKNKQKIIKMKKKYKKGRYQISPIFQGRKMQITTNQKVERIWIGV